MPRSIEMTELERRKLIDAGRQSIACTNGWRPIETAPKDGTKVLLWNNGGMDIYWWHENKYDDIPNWISETGWTPATPNHWQPLPKPPQEDLK